MKISIGAFGAGASGSSGKYDDELGGWPIIIKVDGLVVAAFSNGHWDSGKNQRDERETLADGPMIEYIDCLIHAAPAGTTVEFDDQESWLSGIEWPEDDPRAETPSVTITQEEWSTFHSERS